MDKVKLEEVEEFMNMLTGESLPEGMLMTNQPKLTRGAAFSVIWFLQEHLRVLPDRFEMCDVCKGLFDTHLGGFIINGTDDPDCWHEEIGVTREMLEENDGTKFCSPECECRFWKE